MAEVQLVVYKLGDELCATDISRLHEIIRLKKIQKVPEMPEFIEGVAILRGNVVPIIDLNKKFNLPYRQTDKKTKVIVVGVQQQYVGFRVDDVTEIMRVEGNDIETSVDFIKHMGAKEYIAGVAKSEQKLIALIDLHKILGENELEQLKKTEVSA